MRGRGGSAYTAARRRRAAPVIRASRPFWLARRKPAVSTWGSSDQRRGPGCVDIVRAPAPVDARRIRLIDVGIFKPGEHIAIEFSRCAGSRSLRPGGLGLALSHDDDP